jgi:hypothetical protein
VYVAWVKNLFSAALFCHGGPSTDNSCNRPNFSGLILFIRLAIDCLDSPRAIRPIVFNLCHHKLIIIIIFPPALVVVVIVVTVLFVTMSGAPRPARSS